ncbi:MAG TPA: metallophosphoesterase [Actinomycetota bacterium]|nr:metallophosphoesterase [Actinomycetota bacterium]
METVRRTALGLVRLLLPVAAGVLAAAVALLAFGAKQEEMGPFTVELHSRLGRGVTSIELPPLGALAADTHDAPLRLTATLRGVDVNGLGEELRGGSTRALAERVEADARRSLRPYAVRMTLIALAGGLLVGLLLFRRAWASVAVCTAAAVLAVGGSGASAWTGWRPEAFREPRFSGSLVLAPQLIGSVEEVTDRLEAFRRELNRVVSSAVRAYTALEPSAIREPDEVRVLHVSDIHVSPLGIGMMRQLARGFDVAFVLDTGDLTSYGTPLEEAVVQAIPSLEVPYVFVRGNHDPPAVQDAIRQLPNGIVLDGDTAELDGLLLYGLGHPAYTENKEQELDHERFVELARSASARIASDLRALPRSPDVVAVHDDRMARALAGSVPLVVSGHYHTQSEETRDSTLFLRAGTTGGAGVNLLSEPGGVPLSAQILYFRPGATPRLVAYDVVQQSPTTGSLTIDRRLVTQDL